MASDTMFSLFVFTAVFLARKSPLPFVSTDNGYSVTSQRPCHTLWSGEVPLRDHCPAIIISGQSSQILRALIVAAAGEPIIIHLRARRAARLVPPVTDPHDWELMPVAVGQCRVPSVALGAVVCRCADCRSKTDQQYANAVA